MNKSTLKPNRFVTYSIIFKILLDWSYLILAESAFKYEYYLDYNIVKILISYIVVLAEAGLTAKSTKDSAFLFRLIIFFTMIPLATLYGMRNSSSIYYLLTSSTFIFVEILLFRPATQRRVVISNIDNRSDFVKTLKVQNRNLARVISAACVLFALITLFLIYRSNGLPQFSTLLLNKVYELRRNYAVSKYVGYMSSLTAYVLVPFGVARATAGKKKWSLLFWFLVQFLLFLWTGHKTWLFSIVLLAGMILLTESIISENAVFAFLVALTGAGCVMANSSRYFAAFVFSLFNRRVFLNAASLKYFYYDYFVVKGHRLIGTSGTIFAPIILPQNVDSNYATTISEVYTGITSNANTGIYGGDFANAGVLAFIIIPLLLLFFAYLVSKSSVNCGSKFTIILFSYLAFSFNDQSIIQYFLDFKGVTLILLILLYRYSEEGIRRTWLGIRVLLPRLYIRR